MNDTPHATVTESVTFNPSGTPRLPLVPGCRLSVAHHGRSFELHGNAEGLLLLARALIGVARMPAREENWGYHVHLDDLYDINNEGIEIIVAMDPPEPG